MRAYFPIIFCKSILTSTLLFDILAFRFFGGGSETNTSIGRSGGTKRKNGRY